MQIELFNRSGLTRLGAVLLCAGSLAGCGDRGEDVDAVSAGARNLAAVGSGALEDAEYTYSRVSRELSTLDVEDPAAAAVAAGLLAQSRQGEGMSAAGAAIRAERSLFDEIARARDHLRRWEALNSTAAALTAYDPQEDLDRIAQRARELAEEAEDRRAELGELQGRVDEMQGRVDELRGAASVKRNQAAEIELSMSTLSATQAARQAEQARTLHRQADALEMDANRIAGRVEMLQPEVNELEQEIAKLVEQRELALQSGEQLRESARERSERAVQARAEAETHAEQIGALVSEILDQREQQVVPASETAQEHFEQAVRSAGRLMQQNRTQGQIAKSAAARRLGDVLQVRADGHGRTAALLEDLAGASPSLPEASRYASMAQDEHQAQRERSNRAAENFQAAAEALRGAGVRGAEGEGLAAAAEELEALATRLRGEEPEPESGPEPVPESVDGAEEPAGEAP